MKNIFPLQGVIQNYAWGGYEFIPELLGVKNSDNLPYAELWMGTHPKGTAKVYVDDAWIPLDQFIAQAPEVVLGQRVASKFEKKLPFLFKVLDVHKMLSIQVHPTKAAAEQGFRRENELGIELTAFQRNYRDTNHKPESMVALTDFWLLHGFRSAEEIAEMLANREEFKGLRTVFSDKNIFNLYKMIMSLDQVSIDGMLDPLWQRLKDQTDFSKDDPDYWARLAFQDYTTDGHYDRGIFSIYLFNLVHLKAGEGIFQDAGLPHAYLEGVNIELMADSDNVLRGGLTPKHIDVDQLLKHISCETVVPKVLTGDSSAEGVKNYPAPVEDYTLARIELDSEVRYQHGQNSGPAIFIVIEGSVTLHADDGVQDFDKGKSFFVSSEAVFQMSAHDHALVFRAQA